MQVEAARIALDRAKQLVRDQAGSARDVDEATAQLKLADTALASAEARRDLLARTIIDADKGTVAPWQVQSPADGVVRNLHVTTGQTVAAGEALFEIVNHDVLWIRVPVYVGDLTTLDTDQPAICDNLGNSPAASPRTCRPVAAPPSANADAATVDLFYEIENSHGALRPGQRLATTLRLRETAESLVVPWSAVLHDIHGGTWVYARVGEYTFRRHRVVVRHVVDAQAVLAAGPQPGTPVVATGAAELFGTEFGIGK